MTLAEESSLDEEEKSNKSVAQSNGILHAEKKFALDQVEAILDVVGSILGDDSILTSQDLNSDPSSTHETKSLNRRKSLKKILPEALKISKEQLKVSLLTVRAQRRRIGELKKRLIKVTGNQPIVQKTRNVTRRVITGSEDTPIRDYCEIPKVVKVMDQWLFTFGVVGIMLTEYVTMCHPKFLKYYYAAFLGPLLLFRYVSYHRMKYQYFLYDFCYWTNFLCFLLIFFPSRNLPTLLWDQDKSNELWWKTFFVAANGPLLSAILFWNCSLVFHSVDKYTSIHIHILPPLVAWCERWKNSDVLNSPIDLRGCLLHPVLFYFAWQIVYIYFTEIQDKDIIESDGEIETSMRYLVRKQDSIPPVQASLKVSRALGIIGKNEIFQIGASRTTFAMVVLQFLFTIVSMIPAILCYNYFYLHSCILLVLIFLAIFQGAKYYVQVYSKIYEHRYVDEAKDETHVETDEVQDVGKKDQDGLVSHFEEKKKN